MRRISKVVIPGVLAGSLVGGLLVGASAGPATAGAGTSQTVTSVLHLATPLVPIYVVSCSGGVCKREPVHSGMTIYNLALTLGYTYTSSTVHTAPDVNSTAGKLTGLPKDSLGNAHFCENDFGVAIVATGANFTGSETKLNANGTPLTTGAPKDGSTASVDEVRCIEVG